MYTIGNIKIEWRSRANGAFVITVGDESRICRIRKRIGFDKYRYNGKAVFTQLRKWAESLAEHNKTCKACGAKYGGVHTHNSLCPACMRKAGKIAREGVGHIAELSFSEALQCIPEGVNPVEWERKLDAEIRAERQALVDLLNEDEEWHNLYCWRRRSDV